MTIGLRVSSFLSSVFSRSQPSSTVANGVTKVSDISVLVNDVVLVIHGKKPVGTIAADAQKIMGDIEKIGNGIAATSPYIGPIVSDVASLVADGAALVASRGLDLPAYVEAGATLQQLAAAAQSAVAAYQQALANYQSSTAVIAAQPLK